MVYFMSASRLLDGAAGPFSPSEFQLCLWPAVSPFVMALPVTMGAPGYDGGDRPGPKR